LVVQTYLFWQSGFPKPEVKWYHGDERIKPKKGDKRIRCGYDSNNDLYVLQIQSALIEDSGLYSVKISNDHGSAKATVSVNISKEAKQETSSVEEKQEISSLEEVKKQQSKETVTEVNKIKEGEDLETETKITKKVTLEESSESTTYRRSSRTITGEDVEEVSETSKTSRKATSRESTSPAAQQVTETASDKDAWEDIPIRVVTKVEVSEAGNSEQNKITSDKRKEDKVKVVKEESLSASEEESEDEEEVNKDRRKDVKVPADILSETDGDAVPVLSESLQPDAGQGTRPVFTEKPQPVSSQEGAPFNIFCKVKG